MDSPLDPEQGPTGASGPDRLPRPALFGLVAAALLMVAWIALHAAVDRPVVRARIQARAQELLRARLGPVELARTVEIDWAFRVWLGPLRVPSTTPGAEPLLVIERLRVRASLLAALAGRLEPASARLYGVRLSPGERGREVDAAVARWRSRAATSGSQAPPSRAGTPVILVRGLSVAVPWRGRSIVLGPVDGRLRRLAAGDEERIELDAWLPGGSHAEARLRRTPGPEPGWEFRISATLGVADLPAAHPGGLEAPTGSLSLEVNGLASDAGATATVRGDLTRLRLRGPRLGSEIVGPLEARGEAEIRWTRATRRLEVRRGWLEPAGPLRLEADGALSLGAEPSFTLSVLVPPVDFRALVAALPAALAPPRQAPRPPGRLGGSLKLSGPLTPLVGWTVLAGLDLSGLRAAARAGPPSPLLTAFVTHPDGEDGAAVRLGPPSPSFVPIAELPEFVVRAVTTAEDAGFFVHQGFDFAELLDALSAGAQAGRVVRGGSTISQQLAKNLYLSRDRTLARKVREALVTVGLEASLPKARLLEIYLNLIEWGPGVHGIGPAARHYFAVDPRQLTPRQACFLAAVIPGPSRSHRLVTAGLGEQAYRTRVDDLLLRLNGYQVISDEELQRALEEPLHFAFGAAPGGALADGPVAAPEDDERNAGEEPVTVPDGPRPPDAE